MFGTHQKGWRQPDFNYLVSVLETIREINSEVVCDCFPVRAESIA